MATVVKLRCPKCGSSDTRHSYPGHLMDTVMLMFRRRPHRCRNCRKRFYAAENESQHESTQPESAIDQHAG